MDTLIEISAWARDENWIQAAIGLGLLIGAALLANYVVKKVILRFALRLLPEEGKPLGTIAGRLANIIPALIITGGIQAVPHLPDEPVALVENLAAAFVILTLALAISKALDLINQIYARRPDAHTRPIKGYLQLLKILVFVAAGILMIAALMQQSPLLLLSGLGAMAAVVMLVFKDTILSLVASVQLTSNDMLRVGDWIEMPQLNADGDVIDIALHTVKVQNWDKTITTIPTHRLISESFRNWRGMQDSGGRRIKRSLNIDKNTIRFHTEDEIAALKRFELLDRYFDRKQQELDQWNSAHGTADPVNMRRMTNIGTFRAYVVAYLQANNQVWEDMTLMVRQLQPTPQGLPLEVYCFARTTAWESYEAIQADIFDHLLAILPEFGLRLFQEPSGQDMRQLGAFRQTETIPGQSGT
ncbi:mechanosensitive ion channel family protein [Altericroceibacterium endophyticum]|uniref:Mechanosensing system component YbdG n=1 Tax=Altericroceibacterium endophyticum TaxID=1808508 RepID=A0A6I4T6J2_9SPHN|nr:mechanosensitive ion channel domain-containing protein [Altericroceibacterium endophyticum]MXO65623.1 mechanosensitive ion channel [Altericroceibacterium endophyticum]